MERKKVTVKGVEEDAWETLRNIREIEQRFLGAILTDCIRDYWQAEYEESAET